MAVNLQAQEWESYWAAAIEECHQGNYLSAEQHFNISINLMESENDNENPSIYIDRARLYLLTRQYEEALKDINAVLNFTNLKDKERTRAISIKVTARANLGFSDGYEEDMEFLAKNIEIDVEDTEDHILIKNLPHCQIFKEALATFFVNIGICQSKEDVSLLPSNICIINKNPGFEKESEICCSISTNEISKQVGRDNRLIEGCKTWCDSSAFAAIRWCSFYPELCLVNACNQAVFEIQHNCRACCQTIYNQDVCAAPFGDIVAVMQKYLKAPCGCN